MQVDDFDCGPEDEPAFWDSLLEPMPTTPSPWCSLVPSRSDCGFTCPMPVISHRKAEPLASADTRSVCHSFTQYEYYGFDDLDKIGVKGEPICDSDCQEYEKILEHWKGSIQEESWKRKNRPELIRPYIAQELLQSIEGKEVPNQKVDTDCKTFYENVKL